MYKRIIGFMVAFAAMLAVLVGAPAASQTSAAQAGECTMPGLCGFVSVYGSHPVWVLPTWPNNGTGRTVYPGYASPYKDTDGIHVKNGWCAELRLGAAPHNSIYNRTVGQGYHKITDNFSRYWIKTWDC